MHMEPNPFQLKAAATYNAAADHFDESPLAFWDHHGRRAVQLAALRPGDRVLDVGCGTGASALPAAKAVGGTGHVTGLDVAENMLQRARDKALAEGLGNVAFRLADMTACGEPDNSFDAIISVFSIFFVPDMERQVGELWRMLRPGGRLVVSVWGERSFAPAVAIFAEEVRRVRPEMPEAPRPWERLTVPAGLSTLMIDGGAMKPAIYPGPHSQTLSDPEDWWTIAMGSGFRWEINQLNPGEQRLVKERVLQRLSDEGVTALELNALHAVSRKRSL